MRHPLIWNIQCYRRWSLSVELKASIHRRMATHPARKRGVSPGEEIASTTISPTSVGTPSKRNACTPSPFVLVSIRSLTPTQSQISCLQRRKSQSSRKCPIQIHPPQTLRAPPLISAAMAWVPTLYHQMLFLPLG